MHTSTTADPIATLRAEMRSLAARPMAVRLWQSLADAWLRPLERLAELGVRGTDGGTPAGHRQAARD